MTTLGLDRIPGRCIHGFDLKTQHPHLCSCAGQQLKDRGQAITSAAHPDERAKVEAAIRAAAASGQPFSANSIRGVHGCTGGVVGAAFTAMRKAGVIRSCGDDDSTGESAHGHRIYRWIGVEAA